MAHRVAKSGPSISKKELVLISQGRRETVSGRPVGFSPALPRQLGLQGVQLEPEIGCKGASYRRRFLDLLFVVKNSELV
jgi:hypothetical protein